MDLGCHGIAFCWWFLGKPKVKSVYSHMATQVHGDRTQGEDEAITIIEFENGATGMVESSWNRPGGMDDCIEVFGDKGQTYADVLMGNALPTYSEVGFGYAVEKAATTKGWTYPVFEEHWNYGFPQEMRHFARCVRGKETPIADGETGRVVQKCSTPHTPRRDRAARLRCRSGRKECGSRSISGRIRNMRAIALLLLAAGCASQEPNTDWRVAGGDPGNTRFSPLDQINVTNVAQLQVAWVYHTGDLPPDGHGEIQATPIVVDGVLYATTPKVAVIALRADAGTLLWRFDAFPNRPTQPHVNRGVVYWADEGGHDRRIFFVVDRRLYALDARTGEPMRSLGIQGGLISVRGSVRTSAARISSRRHQAWHTRTS